MVRNLLANIIGKFWASLSMFLFVPLYLHFLGVDNYAVVALGLMIAGILVIMDSGISMTIAREVARGDIEAIDKYRAFKTLETIYFALFLMCVLIAIFASETIVSHLVRSSPISSAILQKCVTLIIVEAGLQMFFRFYVSALMGLERQALANAFNIGWGFARNGLVVVVMLLTTELTAFFAWQVLMSFAFLNLARRGCAKAMTGWSPRSAPAFDPGAFARVKAFAGGIFLLSLVAVANTQLDRIMLVRLRPLDTLAYYTISASIGAGILVVSSPFIATIQPRLTRWFSELRHEEARNLFLRTSVLVAVLVAPLAAVMALNPEDVIWAWTGNAGVARNASQSLPWLVIGYAALAVSSIMFCVAVANGFTRYNNLVGIVAVAIAIPGYWLSIHVDGARGVAMVFMAIQVSGAILLHILLNRRFVGLGTVDSLMRIYGLPAMAALGPALVCRWLLHPGEAVRVQVLLYLTAASLASLVTSWAVSRGQLSTDWGRIRRLYKSHAA